MSETDIRGNISSYMRTKMTRYMKNVLDSVELNARRSKMGQDFFKSANEGFYAVRKTTLDEGNDIIRLFEMILAELEVRHKNSVVEIK